MYYLFLLDGAIESLAHWGSFEACLNAQIKLSNNPYINRDIISNRKYIIRRTIYG